MAQKNNGSAGKPANPTFLSAEELAKHLSMQYRVPTINLAEYEIDSAIIALVPRELCDAHLVLPVSRVGTSLVVATVDPTDKVARDAVEAHTGFNIEPVIATEAAIVATIERYAHECRRGHAAARRHDGSRRARAHRRRGLE